MGFIRPIGRYLVIADWLTDPHLTVYDRSSGIPIRRLGRDGKGPGEFKRPVWMFIEAAAPPTILIFDAITSRLSRLDLSDPEQIAITDQSNFIVGAAISSPIIVGRRVIAGGFFADEALVMVDRDTEEVTPIHVDQPFTEERLPTFNPRRMMNRSHVAVNPSRTLIAVAYQGASRLDFYTASGKRYGSVDGPRATRARFRESRDGQNVFLDSLHQRAYTSIDATDRFVYALFNGSYKGDKQLPYRIHVFSWNGDFVMELGVDRQTYRIAVLPNDSVVYGAVQEPYPAVVEWELPASLLAGANVINP